MEDSQPQLVVAVMPRPEWAIRRPAAGLDEHAPRWLEPRDNSPQSSAFCQRLADGAGRFPKRRATNHSTSEKSEELFDLTLCPVLRTVLALQGLRVEALFGLAAGY